MNTRRRCNWIAIGLAIGWAGCATQPQPAAAPETVPGGTGRAGLEARMKWVAENYLNWGRVDDEARWAPYLCRNPNPSLSRFSQSDDTETHGRKLYFVFAKDHDGYHEFGPPSATQPKSQVIVKQSWHAIETEAPPTKPNGLIDSPHAGAEFHRKGDIADYFQPFATKDGKLYRAGRQGPLFIMMKVGNDDPAIETDDGWIYATIEPDTKEITALGRIESCMKCHITAPYDRLFGLPSPAPNQ